VKDCRYGSKRKLTQFVLISGLLVTTHFIFADITTVAVVTLYSDKGKVVKQWNAIDKGKRKGSCYIFHVRKGVRSPEVKICGGTYTVESVN